MLKYSRQRERIKENMISRCDHPTAEMVYADIQKENPKISLGTVYRNLSLLADLGEIRKITTGLGPDRFDGRVSMHGHFLCTRCGQVSDVVLPEQELLNQQAEALIDGKIETNTLQFYGICGSCQRTAE